MEMKKIDFNNMDEKTKGYIKIGIMFIFICKSLNSYTSRKVW